MLKPIQVTWYAQYICPQCKFSVWMTHQQLNNRNVKNAQCDCGCVFPIERPEFMKVTNEPTASDINVLLAEQGFNTDEITKITERANSIGLTTFEDILTKIVPTLYDG